MARRDRLELIHDTLKVIRDHANSIRPTPLLRYSNLSSQRFAQYYAELLEKGLITEQADKKGRKYVSLTTKGFRYLEQYSTITAFIDDFDL